ncbi:hypothetical protein VTN96DRAFT_1327 [Rasamsonia emersonii]
MNSGSIAVAHPTSTDQSASRFISRRAPPSPARVSLRRAGRSTEQLSPAEHQVQGRGRQRQHSIFIKIDSIKQPLV